MIKEIYYVRKVKGIFDFYLLRNKMNWRIVTNCQVGRNFERSDPKPLRWKKTKKRGWSLKKKSGKDLIGEKEVEIHNLKEFR